MNKDDLTYKIPDLRQKVNVLDSRLDHKIDLVWDELNRLRHALRELSQSLVEHTHDVAPAAPTSSSPNTIKADLEDPQRNPADPSRSAPGPP